MVKISIYLADKIWMKLCHCLLKITSHLLSKVPLVITRKAFADAGKWVWISKMELGAIKMTQWIKPDDLNFIPRTHVEGHNRIHKLASHAWTLTLTHKHMSTYYMYKSSKILN